MLEKYKNIYFLGIGGIGMSSLALYFIDKQKSVGGYDKVKSSITNQLSFERIYHQLRRFKGKYSK